MERYNPLFGDNRMCQCGHAYYQHFDTYNDMRPVGCKYCDCRAFFALIHTNYSLEQIFLDDSELVYNAEAHDYLVRDLNPLPPPLWEGINLGEIHP